MTPNIHTARGLPAWVFWLTHPVAWVAAGFFAGLCAGLLAGSALVALGGGTTPPDRLALLCAQTGKPPDCVLRFGRTKLRATLTIAVRRDVAEPDQPPFLSGVQAGVVSLEIRRGPTLSEVFAKNSGPDYLDFMWGIAQPPCLTVSCAEAQASGVAYAGVGEADLLDTATVLARLLWAQGDGPIADGLRAYTGETGTPVIVRVYDSQVTTTDGTGSALATVVRVGVRVGFVELST